MTASPTEMFFERLGRRGRERWLEKASGTVRFDLRHGSDTEHWLVRVDRGDIHVTRSAGEAAADSVVTTTRTFFVDIVTGAANAMAGMLRGVLTVEGNAELLLLLHRLLSGPVTAHGPDGAPDSGRAS